MYTFGEFFGNMLIQKYNFFLTNPSAKNKTLTKNLGKMSSKIFKFFNFFLSPKQELPGKKTQKKKEN